MPTFVRIAVYARKEQKRKERFCLVLFLRDINIIRDCQNLEVTGRYRDVGRFKLQAGSDRASEVPVRAASCPPPWEAAHQSTHAGTLTARLPNSGARKCLRPGGQAEKEDLPPNSPRPLLSAAIY